MSDNRNDTSKDSGIFSGFRRYIDYRIEEGKLQAAKGLSDSLSVIAAVLISIILLLNALLLLSIAIMEWLNSILGVPWGTVITMGALVILAAIFFFFRDFFFKKPFRKLFSKAFNVKSDNLEADIQKASYYADIEGQRIARPVLKATGFISSSQTILGFAATAATVVGTIFRFTRIFRKKS